MDPRQTNPSNHASAGSPPSSPPGGAEAAALVEGSPRHELLTLVRSVRAHIEELAASGAWGMPRAPRSAARAAATGADALPRGGSGERPEQPGPSAEPAAPLAATASAAGSASLSPAGLERSPAHAPRPAPPDAAAEPSSAAPAARAVEPPLVRLPLAGGGEARLLELANEARACTRCGLHAGRHQSVFSRGGGASGLVFVGEGPGEEEDRQGQPFVGPAGQLLDKMIAAMQLGRDDVYVCNIVKCRPPKNRKPEPDEMARCMPFLDEQLAILQPRVIVALGATAVQGLLGTTEGITRLRGNWKLYRGQIPVMPTFHPAYLLRTPSAKRDVWKDLQEVLKRMQDGAQG